MFNRDVCCVYNLARKLRACRGRCLCLRCVTQTARASLEDRKVRGDRGAELLVSYGVSEMVVVCALVSECVSAVQCEAQRAAGCAESRAEDPPSTEPLADGERRVGEKPRAGAAATPE